MATVICLIIPLIMFSGSISVSAVRYINGDFLLREMEPGQEEESHIQYENAVHVPATLMAEISTLTSDEFMARFLPENQTPVPDVLDIMEAAEASVKNRQTENADVPFDMNRLRMMAPDLDAIEAAVKEASLGVPGSSVPSTNFRSARIEAGVVNVDRSGIPVAENARCEPRDAVVPLPKPQNVSLMIWPQCTTLKRCGGCCGDGSLSCRTTETRMVTRKAMHLAYIRGRLQVVDQPILTLTEDVSCSCSCRQNATDCSVNQSYDAGNCRCVCKNPGSTATCGPYRVWNSETCQCECKASGMCPSGYMFDHSYYCSCLPMVNFRSGKRGNRNVPPIIAAVQNEGASMVRKAGSAGGGG